MANMIDAVVTALRAAVGAEPKTAITTGAGFKAFGDKWFAWWSNAFEDHEGEYFAEKAIDEYVMRVDVGAVPMPELWLWHTPGTKHGAAEWVGRIGHFAVAAGSFDDTPAGKAAQAHYAKAKEVYGMSHGFTYDPSQKSDNIYHQFNTFEISVLPVKAAANPYTAFEEVTDMALTDEKRAFLANVLGADVAAQLIAATEAKSVAMEALDVRYKDFVHMDTPAEVDEKAEDDMPTVDEMTGEAEPGESAVAPSDMGEFVTSITEDVAVLANTVNSLLDKLDAVQAQGAAEKALHVDEVKALRAEVKALSDKLDLRPRSATTDPATEVQKSALTEAIKAQVEEDDYETVLGLRVKKTS